MCGRCKGLMAMTACIVVAYCSWINVADASAGQAGTEDDLIWLECPSFRCGITRDGHNRPFIDLRTGQDHCDSQAVPSFARVKVGAAWHEPSEVSRSGDLLHLAFAETSAKVTVRLVPRDRYLVLEVASVEGGPVDELVFIDVALKPAAGPDETFAACAVALNLQTDVKEIPQANSRLRAMCYARFGLTGAKVAVVGCPADQLRDALKEVVANAEALPKSPIGGPWALDAEINRGSYLMDLRGQVVENTVDQWIEHARRLGITQIDFHTGHSLRFGDYRPNPELYPNGYASVKAVIDKLHTAGIMAGLHTYAQFIAKDTAWVTPVPDPRLDKARTLTLAAQVAADAPAIPVVESTADISPITGFHVRNSATIQIDDELIVFKGVSREPPYQFLDCQRGALGTRAATHAPGAKVHHLKECFGLFVPNGDSTLFAEVAGKTAEAYNECGFDMIYLDALDGSDVHAGWQNAWYYGSKFVFELAGRLKKPALFEMSTFHHHLWFVRSRMGAWDVPSRGAKRFIDMHTIVNESCQRYFLPSQLGWWAAFPWNPVQPERTFPEVMEYLCCKAIGYDSGIALLSGFSQEDYAKSSNTRRLAEIVRRYEQLRLSNYFPESVRQKLRVRGDEFTLQQSSDREWHLCPIEYLSHKVVQNDERSSRWTLRNRFGPQPVRLRIEALMSAGPYEAPDNPVLADFTDPQVFAERQSQSAVTGSLSAASTPVKVGAASGRLVAKSEHAAPYEAWTMFGKKFSPYLDMRDRALGVWVHGDGQGELLNLQLKNPAEFTRAIRDSYIPIDFAGWRYFELIEPESDRIIDYTWPYSVRREDWTKPAHQSGLMAYAYPIYHIWVTYGSIEWLNLYLNNVPQGKTVECCLSPVKALPLIKAHIGHPSVTIGDRTVTFPIKLESGQYLEFNPPSECVVYDAQGETVAQIKAEGEIPELQAGENEIAFACQQTGEVNYRAKATVICQGQPIHGGQP